MIIKNGMYFYGRGLKHWETVLNNWCSLVKKTYLETKTMFSSYQFKERANIGLLSVAAWESGWVAIEEIGLFKKPKGRTDLILWHGKRGDKFDIIEAKHTRQSLFSKNIEKIIDRMDKADSDISENEWGNKGKIAKRKVGIIFIVPTLSAKQYNNLKSGKLEEKLHDYIDRIKKNIRPNVIAWSFPGPVKYKFRTKERILLGIILVGNAFG